MILVLALLADRAVAQQTPAPAPEAETSDESPDASSSEAPDGSSDESSDEPSDEADPEDPDRLAALEAKLAEQAEALRATNEALQAQADALAATRQQLAATKLSLIEPDRFRVDMEGHYRVRGYLFNHLFASQGTGDRYRDARYFTQRLWLRPTFNYKDLAKLTVEARALENVVFGDNSNLSNSTALFAEYPSNTDLEGQPVPSVSVGRAWAEFRLPVGLIRAGRMPSDWGMRLLVSQGDNFDQPFGEASYPTTNDRILFATRPFAIVDAATGREDRGIPFIFAFAVDRLVEDPLYQYYGYRCSPGVAQADDAYDRRCDADKDGVTDLDHGYLDDTVVASSRGRDWWADQNDDVMQMVFVATYQGEGIDFLGGHGDLKAGVWAVNRIQRETDSNAWIVDGYFKSYVHRILLEAEVVSILGNTSALPLPDADAADPLAKKANIFGAAARVGYIRDPLNVTIEAGTASGDDNVADENFTGRSLHPDHNVGLLLYDTVLAEVTAAVRTTGARGLWSNGGVYSSKYLFPTVTFSPIENWDFIAGGVLAWPNSPDGAVIRCKASDAVGCDTPPTLQAEADMIGWELDAAVKHRWHKHLLWSLEAAVAKATDRLPLETAGLNPEGNFFTVQSRLAWEF